MDGGSLFGSCIPASICSAIYTYKSEPKTAPANMLVLTRTPVSSWTSISAVLTLSDGRLPAAATDSRMTFH